MLEFSVSPQEFQSNYLEKRPYVFKAALAERPMQWTDLDALLYSIPPDDVLQLFNNGQVPPNTYVDDIVELGKPRRRLNKQRFYALMYTGATLVLNKIEAYSVPAKHLCTEIGRYVGSQTTSNAYVSFGGKGTFGKHWDTHDVFAIQLIGKKRWQVFAPSFPLPMSSQTSEGLQQSCPATPTLECELEVGDMLYIPRGWWHQVTPFDVGSLHLSVGAYLPTLSDYITWMASRFLPLQQSARGGLGSDAEVLAKLPALMRELSKVVQDRRGLDEFKLSLQARERPATAFDVNLFLDKNGAAVDDHTRVSLSTYYSYGSGPAEISVNSGRLKLEPLSQAIVGLLGTANSLTIGELSQRLPQAPAQAIRAAVLNLASYEVLSIVRFT